MNKLIPTTLLALGAVALAAPTSLAQGTATPIPGFNGGELSPDGFTVAGQNGTGTFTWNPVTGFTYLPGTPTFPADISTNGLIVAGQVDDLTLGNKTAGYYSLTTGTWTSLGQHPAMGGGCPEFGNVFSVSNDGLMMGGMFWNGCDVDGFLWTAATGVTILPKGAGSDGKLLGIAGDGSGIAGGWGQGGALSSQTAFHWDVAGNLTLPLDRPSNPGGLGDIRAFSFDGSSYVGRDIAVTGTTGYIMADGVFTAIAANEANAISADGRVVGAQAGTGGPFGSISGYVYTTFGGGMSALSFFAQFGVTPAAGQVDFGSVLDVSADGNTFLVSSADSFFGESVVITLPNNFADLGGSSTGSTGNPVLDGYGWLNPGLTAGVELSNATPSSLGILAYGGAYNPTPLFGGLVGPVPATGFLVFPTDANGEIDFTFTWPLTMPSGASIYAQYGVLDGVAAGGVALSNTLQITGN